jgi:poly [ADP-ribose] polymerase 2/3/4
MTTKVAKLIMVTAENNNKFYNMRDTGTGIFEVEYGRVEKTCIKESYPSAMWDKKYKEKLKKGYKDVTHLYAEIVTTPTSNQLTPITNIEVKRLIDALQTYAKKSIATNYTVTSDKVTEAQITEAQAALTSLIQFVNKGVKAKDINDKLLHLYHIIPRQMANVKDYLFSDIITKTDVESAQKRLQNEQDTLDVMAGQVALNKASSPTEKEVSANKTLLETLGLTVVQVTDPKEITSIKEMMGDQAKQLNKVFKVINIKTQTAFDNHLTKTINKQCRLFWHGSRNENWFNIISTGLLIRPSGAVYSGSSFGDGIYFASKFKKSYGYTSASGSYWAKGNSNTAYLAVYNVNIGKQHIVHSSDSSLNYSTVQKHGCDSTYAKPGNGGFLQNEEFIVYKSQQCTIQYLIEVTC